MTPAPEPCPITIDSTRVNGTHIIRLAGTLDEGGCVALKQELAACSDGDAIIIELSGLRYIASAGIAVLIQAQKRMREDDRTLHLCQPSEAVNEVFVVLNLATILNIHRTLAQALLAATPGR